jgi:hypothetical protein
MQAITLLALIWKVLVQISVVTPAVLQGLFMVLFSPLTNVPEEYLKFGEDCFLLHPFQFIVSLKASLNKSEVYEIDRRALTLVSCIWNVIGSDFGRDTGYTCRGYSSFPSIPSHMCQKGT